MLWLLACVDPFPSFPGTEELDSEIGSDLADADADTDTDTDTDSDTDADADSDTDTDPLAGLSDEFDQDEGRWISITDADPTVDRVLHWDVGTTEPGWAWLVPDGSIWFQGYRGVLMFQEVTGDFVVTTHLRVLNGAGRATPPLQLFSYAGLMVRAPEDGLEDHLLSGIGTGGSNTPPAWAIEMKTTRSNQSQRIQLNLSDGEVDLAIARLGELVALLLREDDASGWRVQYKECRDDLPPLVQVGLAAAADYNACNSGVATYDAGPCIAADPDVDARYDHVRFATPPEVADPCETYLDQGPAINEALLELLGPWLD